MMRSKLSEEISDQELWNHFLQCMEGLPYRRSP